MVGISKLRKSITSIFYQSLSIDFELKIPPILNTSAFLFDIVKIREFSIEEQTAVEHLRKAGHSFSGISQKVGCNKSAAFSIYRRFEKIWFDRGNSQDRSA